MEVGVTMEKDWASSVVEPERECFHLGAGKMVGANTTAYRRVLGIPELRIPLAAMRKKAQERRIGIRVAGCSRGGSRFSEGIRRV